MSPCCRAGVCQLGICLTKGAFKELLILKVFFEDGLSPSPRERQLRYPQFIDRPNGCTDSVQGAPQRSGLGCSWLLGLCSRYRMLPVLTQSTFKSTFQKWKIGNPREGRASFFHFMQKCSCIKSPLSLSDKSLLLVMNPDWFHCWVTVTWVSC